MQKYGSNPEFRELMMEFSKLMGTHFEDIAEKKKVDEEEKIKNDPVTKIIETDEQVKSILMDTKVQNILERLRMGEPLDLY